MRKLLLRWIISAAAVWIAMSVVEGITAEGGWSVSFQVALILGLVNALIGPILKLLTCPLMILTLGLFTFVINAFLLQLASYIAPTFGIAFEVATFGDAFVGAIIISVASFVLSVLTGVNRKERRRDR